MELKTVVPRRISYKELEDIVIAIHLFLNEEKLSSDVLISYREETEIVIYLYEDFTVRNVFELGKLIGMLMYAYDNTNKAFTFSES